MTNATETLYYYDSFSDDVVGSYDYTIYINNTDGEIVNESGTFSVSKMTPAKVTLLEPGNNTFGFDFRPSFNWTTVSGENVSYTLHLVRIGCFGMSDCNNAEVLVEGLNDSNYTLTEDLDLDSPYNWTVVANNTYGYGETSDLFNYTVQSYVDISLIQSSVSVDGMLPGDNESTEDDTPLPFIVQNNGNVFVNLSVNASDSLWSMVGLDNHNFRFKADENASETGSFNMTMSALEWLNVSYTAFDTVADLDFDDDGDIVEIDIAVIVPDSEPPGEKSASLNIYAAATKPY